MAAKKVVTAAERKAQLLQVGAELVAKHGAVNITRRLVATKAKVSEALVSNYFGDRASLQKKMKAHAKKIGLVEPSAENIQKIGAKMRAHGPRDARDTRKRSVKETKAIKLKLSPKTAAKLARDVKTAVAVPAKTSSAPKKKTSLERVKPKPAPSSDKALPGPTSNKLQPLPMPPLPPPALPALPE